MVLISGHASASRGSGGRLAGLVAVVLLVGGGLLLLLGGDDEAPEPAPGTDRPAEAESASPPVLAGHPNVSGGSLDAGVPAAEADGPTGDSPTAAAATHLLRGRLEGYDPDVPGTARITVKGLTADYETPTVEPVGEARSDGRFEIDLTALFEAARNLVELQAHVEHPHHLPAMARVSLAHADRSQVTGPVVYDVTIHVQVAGLIVGYLENPDGHPVKGATVAVLRMVDEEPNGSPVTRTTTDANGAFSLRVGEEARYAVVAAAAGLLPTAQVFATGPGRTVDLKTLRLARGVSIAGRVMRSGRGLSGAEIEAGRRAIGASWVNLGGESVTWSNGEVFPGLLSARCDLTGHYELAGLVEGAYWVRPGAVEELRVHPSVREHLQRDVEAPSTRVDFSFELARLVILVRCEGRVPEQALVDLSGLGDEMGGVMVGTVGTSGRQETYVVPGGRYAVTVAADGYEETRTEVTAPGPGEQKAVHVILVPKRKRPLLVVTLKGPEGERIEEAGFGFFDPERNRRFPKEHATVSSDEGANVFRLEAWPGRWRMVVRAGGAFWYGRGFYADAETLVDVPEEGTTKLEVAVPPGGRIRIAARAPDGTLVGAQCTLRDARGEEVPVAFCQRVQDGASAAIGMLQGGMPDEVDPALLPGTYTLELTPGSYRPETLEVKVEKGKTTDVDITLKPN